MMSDLVSAAGGLSLPIIAQVAAQAEVSTADRNPAIWWMVGAAAAAVVFNQLSQSWDRLTGRFSRQNNDPQMQTAEGCKVIHQHLDEKMEAFCDRVTGAVEKLGRDAEERSSKLHSRIDPISQRVTAVDARVDDHLADHRSSHQRGT